MLNLLFGFRGRINRAKFWLTQLGVVVVEVIVGVAVAVAAGMGLADYEQVTDAPVWLRLIGSIVFVANIWIGLGLAVKRWHDRNKSGWWVLIGLVPIIGQLWALIECGFLKGTTGPNIYGADPLLVH
jgi:uncharacterized membrane protein YhaH (DUF805 family)